jgi:hypothetical protein
MHYFSLGENESALKTIIQSELEKPASVDVQNDPKIRTQTDSILRSIKKKINKKK